MAILTHDFFAVPDGEVYPRWFRAGDEVSGEVCDAARAAGKLADEPARNDDTPKRGRPSKKAMSPPENK